MMTWSPRPTRERVRNCPIRIELVAPLVERDDFEIDPVPDRATVRRDFTGQQFEQRRFADAVGPDDAEPVAAHHP